MSICDGEPFTSIFKHYSLPTWTTYAEKYGYDLKVFYGAVDLSERARARAVNWQKLYLLGHEDFGAYDQLVWLDADILINVFLAADVGANVPAHLVGCVTNDSCPTRVENGQIDGVLPSPQEISALASAGFHARLEEARKKTYLDNRPPLPFGDKEEVLRLDGLYPADPPSMADTKLLNSGLLVTSPRHHADHFREWYGTYENVFAPLNDNIPLIIELSRHALTFPIDSRFNVVAMLDLFQNYPFCLFKSREQEQLLRICLTSIFLRSFFMHLAGSYTLIPYVDTRAKTWLDLMGCPPQISFVERGHQIRQFPDPSGHHLPSLFDSTDPPEFRNHLASKFAGRRPEAAAMDIVWFDETLRCFGFHPAEVLHTSLPIRWTGTAPQAKFSAQHHDRRKRYFHLFIAEQGGARLIDGLKINVDGRPIAIRHSVILNMRTPDRILWPHANVISGCLDEQTPGDLLFEIWQPYTTSIRDHPYERRSLGVAVSCLVLSDAPEPPNELVQPL